MAKGVNMVTLMGNLGKDPELRYSQSGTAICNFSLATTSSVKKNGEWKDETQWHRVTVFGKTAEKLAEYCSKGSTVHVIGRIEYQKWTDKEGVERDQTVIICNDLTFAGGKSGSGGGGGGGGQQRASAPSPADPEPGYDCNDDVPF